MQRWVVLFGFVLGLSLVATSAQAHIDSCEDMCACVGNDYVCCLPSNDDVPVVNDVVEGQEACGCAEAPGALIAGRASADTLLQGCLVLLEQGTVMFNGADGPSAGLDEEGACKDAAALGCSTGPEGCAQVTEDACACGAPTPCN